MIYKTPQAGEFWEWAGERLRIIGTRNDGRIVGENQAGGLEMSCHIFDMTHLPDCDSFDWQPETFPQWYEPLLDANAAYGIRTNKTELIVVHHDGRRVVRTWEPIDDHRKKITQSEAESRIKKPEPVESPDDWVTQDRVPARVGIDSEHWSNWAAGEWHVIWPSQISANRKMMHGHVDEQEDTLSLAVVVATCHRCHRKR